MRAALDGVGVGGMAGVAIRHDDLSSARRRPARGMRGRPGARGRRCHRYALHQQRGHDDPGGRDQQAGRRLGPRPAGASRAWACGCQNVTLLRLPPYAPELNPVENVWEHLRGNALGMTVRESCTALLDACRDAWNSLMKDAERIVSLITRNWAQVKT